jgi:hypothetical protein
METPKFEEEVRFIPDSKDDPKAFVKVATITNTSQRIVRVVAKGLYSLSLEVIYCEPGRYEWHTETLNIGIEELLIMAKVVEKYVKKREQEEKEEEEEKEK